MRTAPVSTGHNGSRCVLVRIILCIIIRVLITRLMEIVVEDNTIHVVVLNDIYDYLAYLLAHFRERRIEDSDVTTLNQPLWVGLVVIFRVSFTESSIRRSVTIRVEPRMYLNTTCVGRVNHELERIVGRLATTSASKVLTPWLVLRFIHRIAKTTHLEEDGIEVRLLVEFEERNHVVLLLLLSSSRILAMWIRPVDCPHGS